MKKLIFLALMVFAVSVSAAQDACNAVIQEAVAQTMMMCDNLARDSVCFEDGKALMGGFPISSGRPASLDSVRRIQTTAFDETAESYGVGLINASVNLPLSLGQRGVSFLMLGDVQLENAVPAEEAFIPAQPIEVMVLDAANLRSRPSTNDTVLGSANPGDTLMADGLSVDGEWLRVSVEDVPAWVFRTLVDGENIDTLPTIQPGARAIMQAFSLTTGANDNPCAPDTLVIQGLDEQPVSLSVNGLDMNLLGTIALNSEGRSLGAFLTDPAWMSRHELLIPDGVSNAAECTFTKLAAIDGQVFLPEFGVPRGYQAFALDCEEDETPTWDRAAALSPADLVRYDLLTALPDDALRYTVDLPTIQEIVNTQSALASAVVERPAAPEATGTQATPRPIVAAPRSCPGFVPTHPLTGVGFGYPRFYWDPAPGATSYQVNLINVRDELVGSFRTEGAETNVIVDTTNQALIDYPGSRQPFFSYQIIAFQGDSEICRTVPITIQRDFDPDPDCPQYLWFSGKCEDVIVDEQDG